MINSLQPFTVGSGCGLVITNNIIMGKHHVNNNMLTVHTCMMMWEGCVMLVIRCNIRCGMLLKVHETSLKLVMYAR